MEIHIHCRAHDQYPITIHADASFKLHASIRWIYLGSWICDRHMRVTNSIYTPLIALVPMIYPFRVWPAIYSPSKSPFPRSSLVFLRMILIASTASMFTHRLSITLGELGFMLLQLLTNKHLTFFSFLLYVLWPIHTDSDFIDGGHQVTVLLDARRRFYCWMRKCNWWAM